MSTLYYQTFALERTGWFELGWFLRSTPVNWKEFDVDKPLLVVELKVKESDWSEAEWPYARVLHRTANRELLKTKLKKYESKEPKAFGHYAISRKKMVDFEIGKLLSVYRIYPSTLPLV